MAQLKDTTVVGALNVGEIKNINGNTIIDTSKLDSSDTYIRQYFIQEDLVNRNFSTAWGLATTFNVLTDFKAGSLIDLYYLIPMRNDSGSWGGGYIEPQVRFNGGVWQSLGSCGYDGGVMGLGGARIVSYRNFILIDPEQTSDFTVQFRFYCRSYDGTVSWNNNRDIGLISGTAPVLTNILPNTQIFAKQYPSDGSDPKAGIYKNGSLVFDYGRDWHISVWDVSTGNWATGINFYGASSVVDGVHARYDVWNSATRATQQTAFVNTINNLSSSSYVIIVAGSHAPEFYSASMRTSILSIGGSTAKLSWTARSSYICVGRVGAGEGNAYREELNNLSEVSNTAYNWARVEVNLTSDVNDVVNYGGPSVINNNHHAHIKVKEIARMN